MARSTQTPRLDPELAAASLEKIREAQIEADTLRLRYSSAKDEAKELKKEWEAAVKRLQQVIRDETTPTMFDAPPE